MLLSLGTLAKDLSKIEMGGGVTVPRQDDTTSRDGSISVRSSLSSLSSFESPKLGVYLSRNNREVLNILRIYSPARTPKMPAVVSVPEEEEMMTTTATAPIDIQQQERSLPKLPKISALTKNERKNISRLPKANQHDLHVLRQLNDRFIENDDLDVSLKESHLYQKLKAGSRLDDGEVVEINNNSRMSRIKTTGRRRSSAIDRKQHRSHSLSSVVENNGVRLTEDGVEREDGEEEETAEPSNQETDTFFDNINGSTDLSMGELSTSPVQELQKKLQHSFGRRQQITVVIEDQMRRNRLDLPLDFVLQLEDRYVTRFCKSLSKSLSTGLTDLILFVVVFVVVCLTFHQNKKKNVFKRKSNGSNRLFVKRCLEKKKSAVLKKMEKLQHVF